MLLSQRRKKRVFHSFFCPSFEMPKQRVNHTTPTTPQNTTSRAHNIKTDCHKTAHPEHTQALRSFEKASEKHRFSFANQNIHIIMNHAQIHILVFKPIQKFNGKQQKLRYTHIHSQYIAIVQTKLTCLSCVFLVFLHAVVLRCASARAFACVCACAHCVVVGCCLVAWLW